MQQNSTPSWDEVTLSQGQAPFPVPVITTVAPAPERQSLYLATVDGLDAINAGDGTTRWRQQVTLTRARERTYPPMMSLPPPQRATFGVPKVVDGVVYVSAGGYGASMYALNADDGSLRWRTSTDGRVGSMPFMDWAIPLVTDRIVYSGTYALNEQDGTVLWRTELDTRDAGPLALHALSDGTIYATTQMGIYAINAQDGQIRWLHQPDEECIVSGPPVVADRLLYAGTTGSVWYPEKSHCFVLDVAIGAEIARYPMGGYSGAVIHHDTVYVSSGDRSLYAFDMHSGMLRWRHQFAAPGHYPATIANDVLYITTDGIYALSSEDGAVLWRQPLESSRSVSFSPPVVLDGAVYLMRIDGHSRGVLYALNARTGAECWRTAYPRGTGTLAVAQ